MHRFIGSSNKLCGRPPQYAPSPVIWTFDLLTLKMVFESRVTWATCVPNLVFLALSVLDLDSMYATDRQTDRRQPTDVRQHHRLMPPPRERGHNNKWPQTAKINASQAGCTCVRGTEKVKKKRTQGHNFTHPHPNPSLRRPRFFGVCGRTGDVIMRAKVQLNQFRDFGAPEPPGRGPKVTPSIDLAHRLYNHKCKKTFIIKYKKR